MDKYCPRCFRKYSLAAERCEVDGARLIASGEDDLVGKEIDERYRVLEKLGQGGMGAVYVAEHILIERRVALKVLLRDVVKDASVIKRFFIEAKAIAALTNTHTITLFDFSVTRAGLVYFTMELVEGADLAKILRKDGPIDPRRAVELLLQVCDSLEEAHGKGILHRDLKPDNLMISDRAGGEFVTVLDFGIAKLQGDDTIERVTKTGMICGTPAYLSPEQVTGKGATAASDIYSLGIILYEMLTGQPPFKDETPINILMKHVNEMPKPVHQVRPELRIPAAFQDIVEVALRKDPARRIQTAVEFREALIRVIKDVEGGGTERFVFPKAVEGRTASMIAENARLSGFDPTMEAIETRNEIRDSSTEVGAATGSEEGEGSSPSEFEHEDLSCSGLPATGHRGLRGVALAAGGVAFVAAVLLVVWRPWVIVSDDMGKPHDGFEDVVRAGNYSNADIRVSDVHPAGDTLRVSDNTDRPLDAVAGQDIVLPESEIVRGGPEFIAAKPPLSDAVVPEQVPLDIVTDDNATSMAEPSIPDGGVRQPDLPSTLSDMVAADKHGEGRYDITPADLPRPRRSERPQERDLREASGFRGGDIEATDRIPAGIEKSDVGSSESPVVAPVTESDDGAPRQIGIHVGHLPDLDQPDDGSRNGPRVHVPKIQPETPTNE